MIRKRVGRANWHHATQRTTLGTSNNTDCIFLDEAMLAKQSLWD